MTQPSAELVLPPDLVAHGYKVVTYPAGTVYPVRDPQRPKAYALVVTDTETYAAVSAAHGCTPRYEDRDDVIRACYRQMGRKGYDERPRETTEAHRPV